MQILSYALLLSRADFENRFFEAFPFRNVESHPVDEPWPAILAANHLCFTLKPKYFSVSGNDPIGRTQRLAGEEHLCSFLAPSHLVIGMNLLIPPHWIFEPFALRKPKGRLNLRAYIGFADPFVQVGHEHHSGDLLNE